MQLVVNEPHALRFEVNRAALVDPAIHELEQRKIFGRCWIYVGHESELGAPGDFKTRMIAGRPVIFCRSSENQVRVFLNTCSTAARSCAGSARGTRALHLLLPRLDLRPRRRPVRGARAIRVSAELRQERVFP